MPVTKDFEVRAIYLTGLMAGSERGRKIMRAARCRCNAVVFDIKDSDGLITIPFRQTSRCAEVASDSELPKLRVTCTRWTACDARVAIFRVSIWVKAHPSWLCTRVPREIPGRRMASWCGTDPSQPKSRLMTLL